MTINFKASGLVSMIASILSTKNNSDFLFYTTKQLYIEEEKSEEFETYLNRYAEVDKSQSITDLAKNGIRKRILLRSFITACVCYLSELCFHLNNQKKDEECLVLLNFLNTL